jgi:hypothetical protein
MTRKEFIKVLIEKLKNKKDKEDPEDTTVEELITHLQTEYLPLIEGFDARLKRVEDILELS